MRVPEKKWVGYVVLVGGFALVAHARHLMLLGDYPDWALPISLFCELYGGYLLIVLGVFAISAKFLARFVRNFGAGERLRITDGLDHESIEDKRRQRLPLRAKRSAMADFGLVGSLAVLVVLIPICLMESASSYRPQGFYVKVPSTQQVQLPLPTSNVPALVSLRRGPENARYLLNGKEVPADQLEPELVKIFAIQAEWTVYVEADDNLPFSDIMYAVDTINTLGGHPVLLTPKMREEAVAKNLNARK